MLSSRLGATLFVMMFQIPSFLAAHMRLGHRLEKALPQWHIQVKDIGVAFLLLAFFGLGFINLFE